MPCCEGNIFLGGEEEWRRKEFGEGNIFLYREEEKERRKIFGENNYIFVWS